MVESMKETLEVQSFIRKFPWLIQMVKSRLFHVVCDHHTKELRCYFCCDCMIPPLCKLCFEKNEHKDHLTIQAYRCSSQTGVRKETISKYMDTSGIQTYSVNSLPIVFIKQRRENDNHRSRNNVSHKCQVCGWALGTASSAFCSMECKLRNTLGSQLDEMVESSEDGVEPAAKSEESSEDGVVEPAAKSEESSEDVLEPIVKRRHRRKGIPHRSPLY